MSFDSGKSPTIYVINRAKTPLNVLKPNGHPATFAELGSALNLYANLISRIWGTPATVVAGDNIPPGNWGLVFLDDADQADAEGYHDLTPDGLPLGKVFVKTTQEAGDKISVTASHELAEMLIDPAINLCASSDQGSSFYAYEVCDAVEESEFLVSQVPMSNFVFPSWFEGFRKGTGDKYDYLGLCKEPFEILPGGYMPVFTRKGWTQIFGSPAKKERFAKEIRKGHRSESRAEKFGERVADAADSPAAEVERLKKIIATNDSLAKIYAIAQERDKALADLAETRKSVPANSPAAEVGKQAVTDVVSNDATAPTEDLSDAPAAAAVASRRKK